MEEQVKQNLRHAGLLAASERPADHDRLVQLLGSQTFLESLQPLEDYDSELSTRLLISRVIKTLMKSRHAIAQDTLVRLIGVDSFSRFESLEELLVIALVAVRPLPAEAAEFLDARSSPDATPVHLVMSTLAANGSENALRLFEKKIADPEHDADDRAVWLRTEYLVRRNEVPILESYRNMIVAHTVPLEMQQLALESLCTYDPQWYLACTKPEPPLRSLASSEAKVILREILRYAKTMRLAPELEKIVSKVSEEIGEGETP